MGFIACGLISSPHVEPGKITDLWPLEAVAIYIEFAIKSQKLFIGILWGMFYSLWPGWNF